MKRFVVLLAVVALTSCTRHLEDDATVVDNPVAEDEPAASLDQRYCDALEYYTLVHEHGIRIIPLIGICDKGDGTEVEEQLVSKLEELYVSMDDWTKEPADSVVAPEDKEGAIRVAEAAYRALRPKWRIPSLERWPNVTISFWNGNRCVVDIVERKGALAGAGVVFHLLKHEGQWIVVRTNEWIS
jgi:hypothetical protein